MEKFVVLREIGSCSPSVVRVFNEMCDAIDFKTLLEKSEEKSFIKYYVSKILEESE